MSLLEENLVPSISFEKPKKVDQGHQERIIDLTVFTENEKEMICVTKEIEKEEVFDKKDKDIKKKYVENLVLEDKSTYSANNKIDYDVTKPLFKKEENTIKEIDEGMHKQVEAKEQIIELGGEVDRYGYGKGANFHGIPIESYFEYQIAKMIEEHLDLKAPAKFVHDLSKSCIRELTMAGTFEQAQKIYEKFYALDFRKYGVDIPPRLDEMRTDKKLLQRTHQLMVDHKETLSATCNPIQAAAKIPITPADSPTTNISLTSDSKFVPRFILAGKANNVGT